MNVKAKVAVVTGGASGIGLALCTRFTQEGAHVGLSDLRQDACERQAGPIGAFPVAADVGREEGIKSLVAATPHDENRKMIAARNRFLAAPRTLRRVRVQTASPGDRLRPGVRVRETPRPTGTTTWAGRVATSHWLKRNLPEPPAASACIQVAQSW